ncbi:UNVERIFIED_CONTAM: hypothetical protein FKN15_018675, partial [Acipenser sinensis]
RRLRFQNCLIRVTPRGREALVTDFGLAREVVELPVKDPERKLSLVGSAFWMAPEMLRGEPYDRKVDVFSFGIVLCEILGRITADPEVLPRTQDYGLNVAAFQEMVSECPQRVLELANSCCRMEAFKRPSFTELLDELEEAVEGLEPSKASQVTQATQGTQNCLIRVTPRGREALVTDFGLAREVVELPVKDPERKLSLVGSAFWMAPEMLRGEPYDRKVDVFSFGIVLCEILGRITADPEVLPRTQDYGLNVAAFQEMVSECPQRVLELANSCCRMEAFKRPSFTELLDELEEAVEGLEPSKASQVTQATQGTQVTQATG